MVVSGLTLEGSSVPRSAFKLTAEGADFLGERRAGLNGA
jgi:hypothetical protein